MNWNNRPNNQVYPQKQQYTTPPAATYQPATHQQATHQQATYQPATYQPATYQPTKPYQLTTAYQQATYKQAAYQGNTFNNAYNTSPAVPLATRVGSMAPSANQQKYVVPQQPHGSSGVPTAVPIKNNTYNYNIPNQNFASPTNLQTNVNRQASSQVYVPPLNNNTSNSFMPNNLNLETSSGARTYSTPVNNVTSGTGSSNAMSISQDYYPYSSANSNSIAKFADYRVLNQQVPSAPTYTSNQREFANIVKKHAQLNKMNYELTQNCSSDFNKIKIISESNGYVQYKVECCNIMYNDKALSVPLTITLYDNPSIPPRIVICPPIDETHRTWQVNESALYINQDKSVTLPILTRYTSETKFIDIIKELKEHCGKTYPLRASSGIPLIQLSEIEINEEVGHGSFGCVSMGTYHGKLVAVKRFIWKALNKDAHKYYREVTIQHSLKHENIIEVFGMTLDHDTSAVVMEGGYCSLKQLIKDENYDLNLKRCKEIFIDIVKGLAFVHEHNYAHLDIKPENIIVVGDKNGRCKLTDFGCCNEASKVEYPVNSTPEFQAPESKQMGQWTPEEIKKADIYSLACVFYECLTRTQISESLPSLKNINPLYRALIEKCWDVSPSKRYSAKKVLQELQKIQDDA